MPVAYDRCCFTVPLHLPSEVELLEMVSVLGLGCCIYSIESCIVFPSCPFKNWMASSDLAVEATKCFSPQAGEQRYVSPYLENTC